MSTQSPPSPRKSLVRIKLEQRLAGGPVSESTLFEELMPVIPPGRALRRYHDVRNSLIRKHPERPNKELSEAEAILVGARALVRDAIVAARRYGACVKVDVNGEPGLMLMRRELVSVNPDQVQIVEESEEDPVMVELEALRFRVNALDLEVGRLRGELEQVRAQMPRRPRALPPPTIGDVWPREVS